MSRRKTPKAKTLRILDETTMEYRTVFLFNVTFTPKSGRGPFEHVQVYAPSDAEVIGVANNLYANRGVFGNAVSFTRA